MGKILQTKNIGKGKKLKYRPIQKGMRIRTKAALTSFTGYSHWLHYQNITIQNNYF